MSTPRHPHRFDFKGGGQYVPARYAQMRCDGGMGLCQLPPARAPRLIVPPMPYVFGIEPLRVWTTLHYCGPHQDECTAELILTDSMKRVIEQASKRKWSHELRPDFAGAWVQWLLVTTPEYRAFLERLEVRPPVSRQGIPVL